MSPAQAACEPTTSAASSRGYLLALFGMLMSATIFEGYDITIFHLCTPDVARTFHLGNPAIGAVASIVRLGGIMSFIVVSLADRIGRKPIISNTVLCYGFFTLLTALSTGLLSFTLFQSCSQLFLAAEFGIAVVIICEEFPDDWRGRGIAALHTVSMVGVIAAGSLYGYVAESSWGWRGMYLLGIAPLLLVAFLRRGIRETVRFEAVRPAPGQELGLWDRAKSCLAPFAGPYRGRLLMVAALWNSVGLVGAPTITFFSLYAKRDHHWTSSQVGSAIVFAYLMGTVGSLLCGCLQDLIGRKLTAGAYYLGAAAGMLVLFQTQSHRAMALALVVTMFAYQGARAATSTFSSELFPTEMRATGFCWTVQVLGQLAWLLAPVTVGLLSESMGGLPNAAAIFSLGPVVGALLIAFFIPETIGKTLEELSADIPSPNPRPSQSG